MSCCNNSDNNASSNVENLVNIYGSLKDDEKIQLIALTIEHLTIIARDTYIAGSEEVSDSVRLRHFNELQHQISGQLVGLLLNRKHYYNDQNFINMIIHGSKIIKCENSIIKFLQKSMEQVKTTE